MSTHDKDIENWQEEGETARDEARFAAVVSFVRGREQERERDSEVKGAQEKVERKRQEQRRQFRSTWHVHGG